MNATASAVSALTDPTIELKASDRCDRCGARATARASLASGLELLFCNHHARAYEDALKEQAFAVE